MSSIDQDGVLSKMASIASGGTKPISIAVHGDAVYVLNYGNVAGATVNANITGFKIQGATLVAIPQSTQPLSGTGDVHPTDIVFTPDGKFLVVAERFGPNANHFGMIDTFAVVADVAQPGNFQSSAGHEPFAIDFSPEGYMLVAEVGNEMANGSSASSYSISSTGVLTPITSALPTLQGAACWIVAAGGFAYVANAATSTITGLNVSTTGQLSLHDATGMTATRLSGYQFKPDLSSPSRPSAATSTFAVADPQTIPAFGGSHDQHLLHDQLGRLADDAAGALGDAGRRRRGSSPAELCDDQDGWRHDSIAFSWSVAVSANAVIRTNGVDQATWRRRATAMMRIESHLAE